MDLRQTTLRDGSRSGHTRGTAFAHGALATAVPSAARGTVVATIAVVTTIRTRAARASATTDNRSGYRHSCCRTERLQVYLLPSLPLFNSLSLSLSLSRRIENSVFN